MIVHKISGLQTNQYESLFQYVLQVFFPTKFYLNTYSTVNLTSLTSNCNEKTKMIVFYFFLSQLQRESDYHND
ncbi:hypothetical protein AQUCO_06800079v1 [Aquilegia coerulea]|uniref:Uncharacterized protein n=1 Tax=Aquilegia coerulea TaxID=218851 RepID=A0A2G5CBM1_AQUCA|nr:hypothetical protein AQUCO_06800079v1 [Aquilegia coerulea]